MEKKYFISCFDKKPDGYEAFNVISYVYEGHKFARLIMRNACTETTSSFILFVYCSIYIIVFTIGSSSSLVQFEWKLV